MMETYPNFVYVCWVCVYFLKLEKFSQVSFCLLLVDAFLSSFIFSYHIVTVSQIHPSALQYGGVPLVACSISAANRAQVSELS